MTQETALKILKMGANVFLTGEPGSGKTYTINKYISYLKKHGVTPSVTASTGIAATHIGGMTIHSWSGLGIKKTIDEYELDAISTKKYVSDRLLSAKVLIIDEVSMLSPETLESVQKIVQEVRKNYKPFGGLQVILVGDFFQLPPVSKEGESRFLFESDVWKELELVPCYIEEQHRQDDDTFLNILKGIRGGKILKSHIEKLKERMEDAEAEFQTTRLFTHNADVDHVNRVEIRKLEAEPFIFQMKSKGKESYVEALKKGCLSPESLELKEGALVMFTKNNPEKGFQNGTLGEVVGFEEETGFPIIKVKGGQRIVAEPHDWSIEDDSKIKATISQVPLRLAWAITVHKSQGMTFDSAYMDLSGVFEYGQGYVALSRVRTLNGLFLGGMNKRVFEVHPSVFAKDKYFKSESGKAEEEILKIPEGEMRKIHENFIVYLGGTKEEGEEKKEFSTEEKSLQLLRQNFSVSKTAKERGLKVETIITHLEKLKENGKLADFPKEKLLSGALLKIKQKVKKEFEKSGGSLKPVFVALDEKVSYADLRLIRFVTCDE